MAGPGRPGEGGMQPQGPARRAGSCCSVSQLHAHPSPQKPACSALTSSSPKCSASACGAFQTDGLGLEQQSFAGRPWVCCIVPLGWKVLLRWELPRRGSGQEPAPSLQSLRRGDAASLPAATCPALLLPVVHCLFYLLCLVFCSGELLRHLKPFRSSSVPSQPSLSPWVCAKSTFCSHSCLLRV